MKRYAVLASLAAILCSGPLRADPPKDPIEKLKYAGLRTTSQNNLKQIGLAIHSYEDVMREMPRDIADKNGKPLLSWRVAILPYIEQQNLYMQFKLDEPWDSENNKKLAAIMPKTYAPVRGQAKEGQTFYQSFSGKGALMSGTPTKLIEITDGTSNTFMVAEAGEPVQWSKPADLAFDPAKPLPKLGGLFDGDFNVAMCDGSVRFLKKGIKDEVLKKFITISGGEVAEAKELEPAKVSR